MMSNSSDQWNGEVASAEYSSNGAVVDSPSKASTPRRRSRASRKAPTTLLNANTTNFRDLVQQFTGFQAASGSGMTFGGGQRGPVNLSFGKGRDHHHHHHHHDIEAHKSTSSSVMLPFSSNENENYHYQFYQQQQQQQSVVYPFESSTGNNNNNVSVSVSQQTSTITDHDHHQFMEIQDHHARILMEDEEFSLHQLALEFSTSNHNDVYFP